MIIQCVRNLNEVKILAHFAHFPIFAEIKMVFSLQKTNASNSNYHFITQESLDGVSKYI